MPVGADRSVAYFSMEIALENDIPTYSGGLGVLAGDTIRSAADLGLPMVAITLLHRKGYFYQRLDAEGQQHEEPVNWVVADFLDEMSARTSVDVEGREVHLRAFQYEVFGVGGHAIPVYFLDADLPENSDWDRHLTDHLYGGDPHYRLCQEVILGMGGVRMLRALGYHDLRRFHMNEGHASLLTLELLNERLQKDGRSELGHDDLEPIRRMCVFTTHTPVPAGHDRFPMALVRQVLTYHPAFDVEEIFCCDGELNMTYLALNLSHYVNGVAKKHGEVSRHVLTPKKDHIHYTIDSITNGVHLATWASMPFQLLFDRYIPAWREDNFSLRYALNIPRQEVWDAHMAAKHNLVHYVNRETNAGLDEDHLTLGFARRSAQYKRPDLIFQDIDRLKRIAAASGPLQIVFAGKAHPQDEGGKAIIRSIFQARERLRGAVTLVYLEGYDMELGKLLTAGADVWLNTPEPPLEASGTSGMKAALNGVPSLSVLDGWWIEGWIEGITGWAIGEATGDGPGGHDRSQDAACLYEKLEREIVPLFYEDRGRFIEVMRHAIALNGAFFNTHRMIQQYVVRAYL